MSEPLQAGELHSAGFHGEALAADVQEGNFSIHEAWSSPVIPCQYKWTNLATSLSQMHTSSVQHCSLNERPPGTGPSTRSPGAEHSSSCSLRGGGCQPDTSPPCSFVMPDMGQVEADASNRAISLTSDSLTAGRA